VNSVGVSYLTVLYQLRMLCIIGYVVCSELERTDKGEVVACRKAHPQVQIRSRYLTNAFGCRSADLIIVFHFEWCVRNIFMQLYLYLVIIALSTAVLSSRTLVIAFFCPLFPDIRKSIAFFQVSQASLLVL